MPLQFFFIITSLYGFTLLFNNNAQNTKAIILKSITVICIIYMVFFSSYFVHERFKTQHPKNTQFAYEKMYDIITKKYDIHTIYCENYHDVCLPLAYLGRDGSLKVQIINSDWGNPERNPKDSHSVKIAQQNGEKILFVARKSYLNSQYNYTDCYTEEYTNRVEYCVSTDTPKKL